MESVVFNNEAARLEALYQYQILDTPPEQAFDDLAFLAAQICDTPIALISLIDADRQWFKAKVGLDIQEMPRSIGICPVCIEETDILIIPDTLADQRFAKDKVVICEPYIRFYAGVTLFAPGGEAIGTLCVIDQIPRQITTKQVESLQTLGRLVIKQLDCKRDLFELTKQVEYQIHKQKILLNSTTDAVVIRNVANKILFWNKSAENLYGWKSEEVINQNANEILYTEALLQHRKIYKAVLKYGFWQGELHRTSKFGKEIIVESRWTLAEDDHCQAKFIIVVDSDITQKKQLEKQFLRAQRMESLGTLASGIAHDLNNVLSPILMSVQLLQTKSRDRSTYQMLSIIESNAKRGANLVKQVLSFAKGIEGDRTLVQLKHLILEMKQIIAQTFPKSITVHTEMAKDLLTVYADSTQLHQVLINLCLNARDAMLAGGTLTISAEKIYIDEKHASMNIDAHAGHYILLTVTDTGTGINSAILDKIFEPFFTTKEFSKGTGLGLSTVLGIIKNHGGFMTVSSSVGEGTKFHVYLPAVSTDVTQLLEDVEMPTGSGELILVVDDEIAIQEITKISLENYNYRVVTASNGMEAIKLYVQYKEQINAVIIDMMMPNMDGAATIRTLQNINPRLGIIAISGLATSEQIPIHKIAKQAAFLAKPYTTQELLKTLHLVIS